MSADHQQRDARWSASRLLALGMVVAHLLLPLYGRRLSPPPDVFTTVTVLLTLVLILCLEGGTAPDLRLRPRPAQGWAYWFRLACWFGLVIVALTLVTIGLFWALGQSVPIPRTSPDDFAARLFWFCLFAPVVEELIY